MQRERQTRFWVIVGLLATVGVAADWWFFRRCPPAEAAEPHPYDAEWVQAEERRIVAAADDSTRIELPDPSGFGDFAWHGLHFVEIEQVLSVHRLILQSELGREEVEIAGLGGPESWLPAEANAWLEQEGRARLEAHLRAAGQIFEVRSYAPERLPWRNVSSFAGYPWAARGVSGRRLVTLVHDPEHAERDLAATALEEGWTYAADPFNRFDAAFPPFALLYEPSTRGGFHALPSLEPLRAELERECAAWAALDDENLNARGMELARAMAPRLPGLDPAALRFGTSDVAHMRGELRRLDWWFGGDLSPRQQHLRSCRNASPVVALSPPGGRIWVRTDHRLPISLLDWILSHEIVHQYQHAAGLLPPISGEVFSAYPHVLSEGHAEVLGNEILHELRPGSPASVLATAYGSSAQRLREEAAALGRTPVEHAELVLRSFPEEYVGGMESMRPEVMVLLHGGDSTWRGLAFEVATAGEDLLEMRVRNVSGRDLVTRFTGLFVARYAEVRIEKLLVIGGEAMQYRSRLDRFDLAPFVLEIGAGRSITLRIPGEGKSAKEWTALLACHDPIPQADPN